jgi:hypothetical protein
VKTKIAAMVIIVAHEFINEALTNTATATSLPLNKHKRTLLLAFGSFNQTNDSQ